MDKAQAQLLFLLLMAVIFIGQAIHDHIKKNKIRSSRTITRPKQSPETIPARLTDFGKTDLKNLIKTEAPEQKKQKKTDFDSIDSIGGMSQHDEITSHGEINVEHKTPLELSELQKAVIWSEILKRKF